jgi:hypothetical protein
MGFWLGKDGFLALVKVIGALDGVLAGRRWVFSLGEGGWGPGWGFGWAKFGFTLNVTMKLTPLRKHLGSPFWILHV